MAHRIEKNENFAYNQTVGLPWHGLGLPVEKNMAVVEALEMVSGDFTVLVNDTFYSKTAQPFFTSNVTQFAKYGNEGAMIMPVASLSEEIQALAGGKMYAVWPAGQMNGVFATVRHNPDETSEQHQQFLGTVGNRYTAVQNREAINFFQTFTEASEAIIDTVGVLGVGEDVFISAKLPTHITIGGKDAVDKYVVVIFNHNGKRATRVIVTGVRPVCWNTVQWGIATAENKISIRHTTNASETIKEVHRALQINNQYWEAFAQQSEVMAKTKLSDEAFFRMLGLVFMKADEIAQLGAGAITIEKLTDVAGKKTGNTFKAIADYYQMGPGQKEWQGSVWGGLQALTGWGSNLATSNYTSEKRFNNLLLDGTVNKKLEYAGVLLSNPAEISTEWAKVRAEGAAILAAN